MYASQRPSGEKAGSISREGLFKKGFGSPGFQPDFSLPSMGRVMTSKFVSGLSWENARALPSGHQEGWICWNLFSVRRWAFPAPSARIHQRLGDPPFSVEE